jgi:hypothetical protein
MNKRDALRLRPGDQVLFGLSSRTSECAERFEGEVQHVTENGGIVVCIIYGHGPSRTYGERQCIPYHHVIRVTYKAPKKDAEDTEDILNQKWSDL